MKALCWHGKNDVRIDKVPDPQIKDPTDVIIRITASGICGSDLHLLDGFNFLQKPFEPHELLACVRARLDGE